jgi:DNA-binding Xre family transcriptional regulator
MTDTRTALKNGLNLEANDGGVKPPIVSIVETEKKEGDNEQIHKAADEKPEAQKTEISPVEPKKDEPKKDEPKKDEPKKRRGRPTTSHSITKIHLILEKRGLTRKDLFNLIAKKYPDEPISPDAVSRIVSGKRKYYSTPTLFRICGALGVTPNQVLDYEDEII